MMSEMERQPGKRDGNNYKERSVQHEPSASYQEAKREAGISDTQAKRWQKLAQVDEQALADKEKPRHGAGAVSGRGRRSGPQGVL